MSQHEVISAFLDNEPFDPAELGAALADADGRELLLDLVALRHVVHDEEIAAAPTVRTVAAASARWAIVTAAAAMIALASGIAIGSRSIHRDPTTDAAKAPAPTATVRLEEGISATGTKGSE